MNQNHESELRERLVQLADHGRRELRLVRADRALRDEAPRALPLLWLIPGVYVLAAFVGHPDSIPSPGRILGAMLIAPAVWLAFHAARAAFQPIGSRAPLAAIDRHLGLKDSLCTSAEFLEDERRSSFCEAALEDGLQIARTADPRDITLERSGWRPGEEAGPHVAAAVLLFLLSLFLAGSFTDLPFMIGAEDGSTDIAAIDTAPSAKDNEAHGEEQEAPLPTPEKAPTSKEDAAAAKDKEKGGKLSEETKPSEGKTGSGKSSDAQSQTAASESRGAPSGQTPAPPKGDPKKPLESKKPKKKKAAEDKPRKPKNDEDQGGSTAGKGSAKGSNRNTTTSKWSSKDQVTTPDEQEIEDDEDTEDEEEEQENRGGMQPNLRDRRPPVSRDLRIGFGNTPNPDANGRGGPSEAKKSRGTASLVLGVPIPDRIKGQPNPGPTRITQERIEPSAEDPKPEEARAQNTRGDAVGTVVKPAPPSDGASDESGGNLAPWMSRLVKNYFTRRRSAPPASK
ncbi:MAG: hypothetical protein OSB10_01205 [Planctomycetota bacterium]|nr:hypothetical protein [Planctomycetota bacterium]